MSAQGTSVEEEVVAQSGVLEPKEGKEGVSLLQGDRACILWSQTGIGGNIDKLYIYIYKWVSLVA